MFFVMLSLRYLTYFFQVRFSSKDTPKNFIDSALFIWYLSITNSCKTKSISVFFCMTCERNTLLFLTLKNFMLEMNFSYFFCSLLLPLVKRVIIVRANQISLISENKSMMVNKNEELFFWHGWLKKRLETYFQPERLSQVLTVVNLWHTANKIWTYAESEFRLFWIKLHCTDLLLSMLMED